MTFSVASNVISCTVPEAGGSSSGARAFQSVPGIAAPSIFALVSAGAVVAVPPPLVAALDPPITWIVIFIPASLCPGTVHQASVSASKGPITRSAFVARVEHGRAGGAVHLEVVLQRTGVVEVQRDRLPGRYLDAFGVIEMSASVTSNSVSPPAAATVLPPELLVLLAANDDAHHAEDQGHDADARR